MLVRSYLRTQIHKHGQTSLLREGRGWLVREKVHNGSPTSCMPLNSGSSLQRWITLPLGAFLATEPLITVPSVVSMQPTEVSSPDLIS